MFTKNGKEISPDEWVEYSSDGSGTSQSMVATQPVNATLEQLARMGVTVEPDPPLPPPLPPPIPTIDRRQCRLWLLQTHGKTKADVDAAIAAIPDPTARAVAQIEWEDATVFHYDHPLIAQLASVFGIDPATFPDAFRAAALL